MESFSLKYVRGKISKEEYLASALADLDFSSQCEGIDGCEDFIKGRLSESFWEMDKLDRADDFWNQTNKLPTLSKLSEFAQYQIDLNSNDVDAAWLKIITALVIVSDYLEPGPWRTLKESNEIDIHFLVRTAWNVSVFWTNQNIKAFTDLILELGLEEEIESELEKVSNISDDANQWVHYVRSELESV